jgi:tyrosine-protein kinase Etk/Wzc
MREAMATETPISELNGRDEVPFESEAAEHARRASDQTSVLDLLIILAERKRMIFRVTLAFALIAIIVSLVLPVRYTATVILLPPQQGSSASLALSSELGGIGGLGSMAGASRGLSALAGSALGFSSPNDMYVAMLKSDAVEDAMIEKYGLMKEYHKRYLSDTRKKFEHYTTINGSGKDRLIHISIEDHDPRRAAELANGYVAQFRKLTEHLAVTEASQRKDFFEEQLKQADQKLGDAEEALKETELKTGLIQVDSQARALIETVANLRAQIAAREMMIQGMHTYATGQNAQYAQAEQQLKSLRAQLAKLGGDQATADGLIVPKGKIPEASLEYLSKLRDVKYYEAIFEVLARQYELAKLDEAKEGAMVQVVAPAIPPDKKSFPKRALIVSCATVAGFLLAIFLALWQASLQRMEEDPETSSKLSILRRACSFRTRRMPQS